MSILLRRHNLMAASNSPTPEPPSPREQPFTIINNRDANCNIAIKIGSGVPTTALERINYRIFDRTTGNINEDSIINKNGTAVTKQIPIPNYSYVEFFGKGSALGVGTGSTSYTYFVDNNSLDDITVKGNIMSLLYGIDGNFKNAAIETSYAFSCLFKSLVPMVDAQDLILPSNATVGCYYGMFGGCTKLQYTPQLPATVLAKNCYNSMFYGCTSLTTAPVLPASEVVDDCYYQMFRGCTSLTYVKCLVLMEEIVFKNTPATYDMLNGVANSGTFVKAVGMTAWSSLSGRYGIPSGWTVVDDTE